MGRIRGNLDRGRYETTNKGMPDSEIAAGEFVLHTISGRATKHWTILISPLGAWRNSYMSPADSSPEWRRGMPRTARCNTTDRHCYVALSCFFYILVSNSFSKPRIGPLFPVLWLLRSSTLFISPKCWSIRLLIRPAIAASDV
jgi:hypothetical protein